MRAQIFGAAAPWWVALAVLFLTGCLQEGGSSEVDAAVDQGPLDGAVLAADAARVPDAQVRAQCANGRDDDGDGAIDLEDRGCARPDDDDESDEPPLAECANALDDDGDGFVDFPEDPGCGSVFDDDEGDETPPLPQCLDGVDNDADGRVDLADPGCASGADPREQDPDVRPVCFNGLDDDEDGVVDFPLDRGCSAAGDETEEDLPELPACANGLDDDDDGQVDYPWDSGCAGRGDRDEGAPEVVPGCADGVDNDRDGLTDYPEDRGCESAADAFEGAACGRGYEATELLGPGTVRGSNRGASFAGEGTCGGRGSSEVVYLYRLERAVEGLRISTTGLGEQPLESTVYVRRGCVDAASEVACARGDAAGTSLLLEAPAVGDYYVFVDGATGQSGDFELTIEEVPLAQCLNGLDDDEDGRVDFPNDPGCERWEDRDEVDPLQAPECANDLDDDGDGLTDFPLDPGCRSAADRDEADLCGAGLRFEEYPVDAPFVLGSTLGGTEQFQGSCGGRGIERIFAYENPFNASLVVSVNHPETLESTTLYVRSSCTGAGSELACNTGERGGPTKGTVSLPRVAPGTVFFFVDQEFGQGGDFKLSVTVERLPPGCSDAEDNDGDGFIDLDDLGCETPDDEDERDPLMGEPLPVCFNGADDDGDGLMDYPYDPGCMGKGDADEADPAEAPQCANGLDDDENGLVDFPLDVGCFSAGDPEEAPGGRPQCENRVDDDQDGLTDFPVDPGCAAPGDLSERDEATAPACADQMDNDRDGLVDYPFDAGCFAAGDRDESNPAMPVACSNDVDDDEDGRVDFPRDPGCSAAGDLDETDGAFPPECANGRDDDGNGRTDWPDDPGCAFAGDTDEDSAGAIAARCADGLDNDDDGVTDLADPGCLNARDNDEADPAEPAICDNGLDDDEDGVIDWPEDEGCAAQGDECEQAGWGLCGGVCLDVMTDAANCGRCGRACSDGVACEEGRCGELREVIMVCGRSSRDVNEFVVGELQAAELRVVNDVACIPDQDTQAVVVTRGGAALVAQNSAVIQAWVRNGGVLLTEYNVSDEVFNAMFPERVVAGARNGDCQDNVQPRVQYNPQDRFWTDNPFVAVAAGRTGCGHAINAYPGVTLLGGWDANNASIGYRELGAGRVWLVEADWQDSQRDFTEESVWLMAYMIANGPVR
jgi:hypothetical protein